MNMTREPSLHKPVPMGSRVKIPEYYIPNSKTGTVVGISLMYVIFTYIVLLDEPIDSEFGKISAIAVHGTELVSEDGLTHWRLDS